jgi:hypothetical protein
MIGFLLLDAFIRGAAGFVEWAMARTPRRFLASASASTPTPRRTQRSIHRTFASSKMNSQQPHGPTGHHPSAQGKGPGFTPQTYWRPVGPRSGLASFHAQPLSRTVGAPDSNQPGVATFARQTANTKRTRTSPLAPGLFNEPTQAKSPRSLRLPPPFIFTLFDSSVHWLFCHRLLSGNQIEEPSKPPLHSSYWARELIRHQSGRSSACQSCIASGYPHRIA